LNATLWFAQSSFFTNHQFFFHNDAVSLLLLSSFNYSGLKPPSVLPNANHSTSCYSLTGILSPYDLYTYIPCNLTAVAEGQHSACCAPGDKCLANGLCEYGGPNPNNANEFWRVGCTDPTYQDSKCPKYCKDVEKDRTDMVNHLVFSCPGGGDASKWCCATGYLVDYEKRGSYNTTCCGIEDLAFEVDGDDGSVFTTASIRIDVESLESSTREGSASATLEHTTQPSISATTTVTLSVTDSVTATAAPQISTTASTTNTQTNGPPALALGLGFGLGIPLTISFIIALFFLFLRFRRRIPNSARDHLPAESQEDLRRTHPHVFHQEILSKEMAVEMEGRRSLGEMYAPADKKLNEGGTRRDGAYRAGFRESFVFPPTERGRRRTRSQVEGTR
jgi:hypothetical protein